MQKVNNESIPSSSSPHISRVRASRSSVPSEDVRDGGFRQVQNSCSTTPCTPVTTMAPSSSLNSPAFSPGSHPNIYSPTNSSVFSPSSTSPASYNHGPTPPSTPPVKGNENIFERHCSYMLHLPIRYEILFYRKKTFCPIIANWSLHW